MIAIYKSYSTIINIGLLYSNVNYKFYFEIFPFCCYLSTLKYSGNLLQNINKVVKIYYSLFIEVKISKQCNIMF